MPSVAAILESCAELWNEENPQGKTADKEANAGTSRPGEHSSHLATEVTQLTMNSGLVDGLDHRVSGKMGKI